MPVSPIPEGYHSVTPYLILKDAAAAIEFYKKALGAVELFRMEAPGGKIGHAEIKIGDSHVMLSDAVPEMNCVAPQADAGTSFSLMIYVQDVDAVLVLNRWGPDHFAPAMQAVDLGLPLFVDKPLCDDPQEAVTLVRAAAAAGVPLTSASAVRYDRAIRQLLERLPDLGRTRSIMFTLPQNWQLYGVHAVDVMHAVFGVGAEDVTSVRGELGDVVTIRWPHGQVGIANQAREAWMGMLCVALGEKGWTHADMPGDDTIDGFPRMYLESIKQFLAMLETGERPISDAEMVDVIRVVAAAERSATSDSRRVPLSEMPAL